MLESIDSIRSGNHYLIEKEAIQVFLFRNTTFMSEKQLSDFIHKISTINKYHFISKSNNQRLVLSVPGAVNTIPAPSLVVIYGLIYFDVYSITVLLRYVA